SGSMSKTKRTDDLPARLLTNMYRQMLRIRYTEEGFVQPVIDGEIRCPVHLSSGQEAAAVGVGLALNRRDYLFGTHRSHGHHLAKGGNLNGLVAEVFCRETGCAGGRGGSMHVIDPSVRMIGAAPIVAGTVPLAVGAALGAVIRREKAVAVACFGDGAMGEGTIWESMNLAAVLRLPVLFVCENNNYSTHMPILECRVRTHIADSGESLGVPGVSVDGNDVVAVYRAAIEARHYCLKAKGPKFLELKTYRLRGHVGPDDNIQGQRTDIRPAAEIARWRKRDPILLFARYLESAGHSKAQLGKIETAARKEVDRAFGLARAAAFPDPKEFAKHVFRDAHT
ncbi:MAG: thiamine pyrophosphate-dependent dehydrogenase E1 component subunit alpha, partial [Vicinamibacterales bacterium]|nr:thiamine pyrophosphate-dependent dehydrogenase E1 component subunit alpha [Vicinamibacterales bacterium]